jgi:TctA family transporter
VGLLKDHSGSRDGTQTMSGAWLQAFSMVMDPYNIVVMLAASLFGLFVGAMPGLTATMATALLVPVTFFMAPIPAIAAIVTATAMAIFAGDIPGCLLRMPGTPASAAYTDEAYAMTNKGQAELALGAGLVFSADRRAVRNRRPDRLGAHAGGVRAQVQLVRILLARADGADLRVFLTSENPVKGSCLAVPSACSSRASASTIRRGFRASRFGSTELMGGIGLVPLMIGMFAISEIVRYAVDTDPRPMIVDQPIGNVFKGMWALTVKYPKQILRGSALGTSVGRLPGAGRRHRRLDVVRGQQEILEGAGESSAPGHVEGIVESGSATTARSRAPGFPRWCSAFPATRSPRS